jgi:hypothetical protein
VRSPTDSPGADLPVTGSSPAGWSGLHLVLLEAVLEQKAAALRAQASQVAGLHHDPDCPAPGRADTLIMSG